ncbi:hypothetical protein FV232_28225 [Methylobacterium sp. WL30]|uniref:hypothetical protein n=1 Tax=unclassified Methylobacterium TaxID=2615210 RepID=UPI0011CC31DF|nr:MULTISPECIES: hypothetical protein [unclassified Methylobacterium]TXN34226.1 hypothetical protein FV225_17220 [Methylobacterium sp. WL93]TXN44354.1 hypothetical protein FV227_26765 [Methylobacterium sp. WL119]TXN60268.1 hypothetical protein FV232_28225 [Methylobacterium sp. WL30]
MRLVTDPTRDDLVRLLADAPDGDVRALRAPNGKIYAWSAHEARHVEVAAALDLPFGTRSQLQAASYLFNRRDQTTAGPFVDFEDLVRLLSSLDRLSW